MAGRPRVFYLIGVGGTAMAPLAGLLVEQGHVVLGSDNPLYPPMSDFVRALGIAPRPAWNAANVTDDVEEVVAGNLASRDNPELLEAARRGLPVRSMPQTLREEILAGRHPVVVTGTHGKTTTTALTAWLLASAGRSPGFLVGGQPRNFPSPQALGSGPAFVVEGDEYSTSFADKGPKFLHYAPQTLILTSVEFDHGDLYADLEAVKAAFRKVVALVPPDGRIVANGDDANVLDVLEGARARIVLYGVDGTDGAADQADVVASGLETADGVTRFDVRQGGQPLLSARLPLAGRHNVSNALAAIGAAQAFSLTSAELAAGLAGFRGVKRRLEEIGSAGGVTVLDDFAHHPTAVGATVLAARAAYPGRRLWAVFEPRSITGCRAEFAPAYARALRAADGVALARPFHAARLAREGSDALDVAALANELGNAGVAAFSSDGPDALAGDLLPRLAPGDVVLVMSSGSFGGLHGKLLSGLAARG